MTSATPSILLKGLTTSVSINRPKLSRSTSLPSDDIIANLAIGLSSEFDVLTLGDLASSGNPVIPPNSLNKRTKALSIS